MKRDTLFVTAGRDESLSKGAVNVPVFRASTVLSPDMGAWKEKKARQKEGAPDFYYGRSGTPTGDALLQAVTEAEGGALARAFPSGLAACCTAILAVAKAGDHILMTDTVYGPVRRLATGLLARMNIEVTYFDPRIGTGIEALFRDNTTVAYLESPGSQTMELMDVPAIAAIAKAHGAATLLDNTWSALVLYAPFDMGVDISIHAATKYIVGHSDAMVGLCIANDAYAEALNRTALDLGQTVAPDDAYLALRGMRTLPLRMARHQQTGLELAGWLADQPEVLAVHHPGLPHSPDHAIWKRDYTGASGLFSFTFTPEARAGTDAFVDALHHFGIGASWGGFESLALPAAPQRTAPGAQAAEVVRIHAGLEDVSDLLADLENGFTALRAVINDGR